VSRAPVVVVVGGLLLALALVLLGARLAGTQPPPPELPWAGTSASPRPVNVILRDYSFDPTPLHLQPGETIELNLINGGLVEHELVLGDEQVQQAWALAHQLATPPAPFATSPPAEVPAGTGGLRVLLGTGQSATVSYSVPEDVVLLLMCHLPGHVERGMVGRIELVEAQAATLGATR